MYACMYVCMYVHMQLCDLLSQRCKGLQDGEVSATADDPAWFAIHHWGTGWDGMKLYLLSVVQEGTTLPRVKTERKIMYFLR